MRMQTYKQFKTITKLGNPAVSKSLEAMGVYISPQGLAQYEKEGGYPRPDVMYGLDEICVILGFPRGTLLGFQRDEFAPQKIDVERIKKVIESSRLHAGYKKAAAKRNKKAQG